MAGGQWLVISGYIAKKLLQKEKYNVKLYKVNFERGSILMFGYIKPDIPELKVKEHELYKATYCGLCRTMGKCTGCMSKLTLSYDFAFLGLIRMVTDNVQGEIKMRRCIIHPFKKRPMVEMNESLEFCAKSSVILTKMKLKDNVNDSRGLSKIKAKIARLVSIFFRKTDEELKPLEEKITECIDNLTVLEKANSDSIDETAATFGELLGNVAAFGYEEPKNRILYEIGFHLGKWIYVIDAIDDMKDDIKKKSYNVLVNSFGDTLIDNDKDILNCAMMLELDAMSKGLELIDFSSHRDIESVIKNIVYSGMIKETRRVLKLDTCVACKK